MLLGYDILLDNKLQAHLIGESLAVKFEKKNYLLFDLLQRSTAFPLSMRNQILLMSEFLEN